MHISMQDSATPPPSATSSNLESKLEICLSELQDLAALVPAPGGALLAQHGQSQHIGLEAARRLFRSGDVLVANAAFIGGRSKTPPAGALYDVLELFAFVRPGQPIIPNPLGLARALGLALPHSPDMQAETLGTAAALLLGDLAALKRPEALRPLAMMLLQAGWRWAELVLALIGRMEKVPAGLLGLDVWRHLSHWDDDMAAAKPGSLPVSAEEVRSRLAQLVGHHAPRPEQADYAVAASHAFGPREQAGAPRLALIEAGTGIGKTLGYLAPASVWAEKNGPGLWLSTYTRNLQRQIVQEIAHLYPDPAEREAKAVVRKGRENYLCLLNYEDVARRVAVTPGQRAVSLALIARWISATSDGDLSGQNFPAFLASGFPLRDITDRRGECIYAACMHYRSCFIEKAIRRARHAPIVVANHALVISQAAGDALALEETNDTPPEKRLRYVFDEGHHLFDAADSGFSAVLSGHEMADMRRWIRGPEGRARSRMRGLEERLKDLIADDAVGRGALNASIAAAGALAGEGWHSRVTHDGADLLKLAPGEIFLAEIYRHVRAQGEREAVLYSAEAQTQPASDALKTAALDLAKALRQLARPLLALSQALRQQLDVKAKELEPFQRGRIDAAARGLARRAKIILPAWISMLESMDHDLPAENLEREFVDWFEITREDGRDIDIGLHRHWVDPTIPLATEVLAPAHGALITSATLRDLNVGAEDWASADIRTGAHHLPLPPKRAQFGSPFAYGEQARIFIVRDVNRRDVEQVAAAYRELFLASAGGGLGLFTAVRALRAVEARIQAPLEEAGISLYAQHVDKLDTGALVDLFRAEENACLLGTDALRDGVDVPGRSLRLVVFDKLPWPKPSILHKARRARFGRHYDDVLTRLKLKQAFGRLIRSQQDRGCFVILEPATPSRLLSAFPADAVVRRCGLAESIAEIRGFLGADG